MMLRRFALLSAVPVLTLFTSGCIAPDQTDDGEELGSAPLAQLDGGEKSWRLFTIKFDDSNLLAKVLVINGAAVGNYSADTEYWYVETGHLSKLGSHNLSFSYVDGSGTPSSLSGDQTFTMPRLLPWSSFSSDPVSGGNLYKNGNVYLRIANSSSGLTRLTWYQTTSGTAANVTPNGAFTSASSVTVPSGQTGYDIDRSIQ